MPDTRRYETRTEVPDGNAGVRQSMTRLAALIREGAQSSLVRAYSGPNPERGLDTAMVERLTAWVRGHLHYTPDPPEMERITSPAALLEEIGRLGHAVGDCDEYVSLLGGLLAALGLPVELILTSTDPDAVYRHVLLAVYLPDGTRLPVDVSSDFAVGYEAPEWTAREVIPV